MTPTPAKKFWGKHFWFIIHYLALKLPTEDFFKLLTLLSDLLPCFECRIHLKANIISLRKLKDKDSFELSYDLHATVNHQLGVRHNPEYAQVKKYYVNHGSGLVDKEFIFVLRAICFKYDNHLTQLQNLLSLVTPYTSSTLQNSLKSLPLTIEYETQQDLFFWSIRVGNQYLAKRGQPVEKVEAVKNFFESGMSDDCEECNLS